MPPIELIIMVLHHSIMHLNVLVFTFLFKISKYQAIYCEARAKMVIACLSSSSSRVSSSSSSFIFYFWGCCYPLPSSQLMLYSLGFDQSICNFHHLFFLCHATSSLCIPYPLAHLCYTPTISKKKFHFSSVSVAYSSLKAIL